MQEDNINAAATFGRLGDRVCVEKADAQPGEEGTRSLSRDRPIEFTA